MLTKVISGGQTGVDQAALRAAKKVGLQTGGWAPKFCRTLDGNNYSLQTEFGLKQHSSMSYPPRTKQNIISSDGTLAIARTFSSPGEKLTATLCRKFGQPYLSLYEDESEVLIVETSLLIIDWLITNNIRTLNVAGNSEQTAPGIGEVVEKFLVTVFKHAIS